jgi:hypothetical protein
MKALKTKISAMRLQALNLIECYGLPDLNLNSSIGNSFGDVYESQINYAWQSKLNQSGFTLKMLESLRGMAFGPKL